VASQAIGLKIEFCLTLAIALTMTGAAADRELIGDPQFKRGFSLLDPTTRKTGGLW
jgi:hypothetical protein